MEKELNIAEILKDKPKGTKLWSPAYGQCKLHDVELQYALPITIAARDGAYYLLLEDTRIYKEGEPMLFPSKEMRDWEKFAWKKGNILKAGVDNLCMFDNWENNDYTEFHAEFATPHCSGETFETKEWTKETNEDTIKQYISKIEEIEGGKLNLETLEIEKQPEFKDGDILTYCGFIFIFKNIDNSLVYSHASYDTDNKDCIRLNADIPFASNSFIVDFKYATEEERQRLFDALAKKGKRWDAEKKQIVDMPKEEKKCEFETFQKVLVRDLDTQAWKAGFFSCYNKDNTNNPYYCISTGDWRQCIPYNEETKHLLGTTDDWEGGE